MCTEQSAPPDLPCSRRLVPVQVTPNAYTPVWRFGGIFPPPPPRPPVPSAAGYPGDDGGEGPRTRPEPGWRAYPSGSSAPTRHDGACTSWGGRREPARPATTPLTLSFPICGRPIADRTSSTGPGQLPLVSAYCRREVVTVKDFMRAIGY